MIRILFLRALLQYERRGAEISDPHIETLTGERVNVLTRGKHYDYVYEIQL